LRHIVGEGAFGRVYEAFDPVLRRVVALKVARPEQLHSAARVERFLREARSAANLLHPNIVAVFDSGSDGPFHFIASAFVPGPSLAEALAELPPGQTFGVRRSVELVRQLAEALAYAHRQGVVHRDVKPGNVLLRPPEGEALLADFGLAARAEEERLTLEGQVVGTPDYMAPEQALGQASPASDQYSLGCLLYELLTGRPPFAGNNLTHTLFLHQTQAPVATRSLNAAVPLDVETICLKSLEKEPGRRYPDCQELADDLRRWLEGEPIRARRLGLPERLLRWARREPRLAALTGALVPLLVVVAVGCLWLERLAVERELQREERRGVAQQSLSKARDARKNGQWTEARAVLQQALAQPGLEEEKDLQADVETALQEVTWLLDLEAIRQRAARGGAGRAFDWAVADKDYAAVFAAADLVVPGRSASETAARIQATDIAQELVAALDDWAVRTTDGDRRAFLLEVARTVAPGEWSDRLRDPGAWRDRQALARLADQVPVRGLPPAREEDVPLGGANPQLLHAFSLVLASQDVNTLPFLHRARARYPDHFWLAYQLGSELQQAKRYEEAEGYARVALAVRADSSAGYVLLGSVLLAQKRVDEAVTSCQKAAGLPSAVVHTHGVLGRALLEKGEFLQAEASTRRALQQLPDEHPLRTVLSRQLQTCQRMQALEPKLPAVLANEFSPGPTELLEFADLCLRTRRHQAAARLAAVAFQADPRLAANLEAGHCYRAACAAVLAGRGQGVDAGQLDDRERTRLRQQGLGWLRADLALWRNKMGGSTAEAEQARRSLGRWPKDPDLASVREPRLLAKLPMAEQAEWERLWADLAEAVRRPAAKK
jgi:tetratricopeptide (TPR) repeat protein/tRNA A-37 threonylcarbamoyl transferase component Bud32